MRKHLIACISLCCATASAQAPVDTTGVDAHLLPVLEVRERAPREATASAPTRVVDSKLMEATGVTSLADAIRRMPGVNLRDYGGAGGLKTVSVRGFGAGHTSVIYDGIALSDCQTGQIDVSRYSIDNVDRLAMTVGDNDDILMPARAAAASATLNVRSFNPGSVTSARVQLRTGSFGLWNAFATVNTPVSSNLSIGAVGEFTHARNDYPFTLRNGTLTTTEHRKNSRMNTGHGELNLAWATGRSSLEVKAYAYRNKRQLPGAVIYYNDANNESLGETNAFVQARFRTSPSNKVSILANAKFNFAASDYQDINGKYPGGMLDQRYRQREWYASAAALWLPAREWAFDYSADVIYNNLNSNLKSNTNPHRTGLLQTLTGRYRTGALSLTARALWSVYLNGQGLKKADAPQAPDVGKLSPSFSLSYRLLARADLYLRASYKNIFRMPTFNEAYFDHYGSIELKPESTDQCNIGVTYSRQSKATSVTLTVDGYLNHTRDMIVAVPYNMFIWTMTNLGKVKTLGLEASVTASCSPAESQTLLFTAGYSHQRAMPRTDPESAEWNKQVAYIPRNSGSAALSWENPWVDAEVHCTATGCRYTTNANRAGTRIAGYAEFGASLRREFAIGSQTLGARIDLMNILNKQYCIVARYPMPGRSWQLTLTWKI